MYHGMNLAMAIVIDLNCDDYSCMDSDVCNAEKKYFQDKCATKDLLVANTTPNVKSNTD